MADTKTALPTPTAPAPAEEAVAAAKSVKGPNGRTPKLLGGQVLAQHGAVRMDF
jgi:hypothetical protein